MRNGRRNIIPLDEDMMFLADGGVFVFCAGADVGGWGPPGGGESHGEGRWVSIACDNQMGETILERG